MAHWTDEALARDPVVREVRSPGPVRVGFLPKGEATSAPLPSSFVILGG